MTSKNNHSSPLSPVAETRRTGAAASIGRFARSAWSMYYDGFRSMTVGKTLWAIILVKLFLFFVVIKLLFFPDVLKRDFDTDEQRADHVRQELLDPR